jgi:hypothetical protein
MQPLNPTKNPFNSLDEVQAFIKTSTIKGRKFKKLLKELEKEGINLKITPIGKKYRFEAGEVNFEVKRDRKSSFSDWIHNIRKGRSSDYKTKSDTNLEKIAEKLFAKMPKEKASISSPEKSLEKTPVLEGKVDDLKPIAEMEYNGNAYVVWKKQGDPTILSAQLKANYDPPTPFNIISIGIKKGSITSVYVDNVDQKTTTIPEDKRALVKALFSSMNLEISIGDPISLEKLKAHKNIDVNNIQARKNFLKDLGNAASEKSGNAAYKDEVEATIKPFLNSFLNDLLLLDKDKQLDDEELKLLYQIGSSLSQDKNQLDIALKYLHIALHQWQPNSTSKPPHEQLVALLQPLADLGNQKAQFELGYVLSKNKSTQQKGIKLISKLAKKGLLEAKTHLMLEQLRLYETTPCAFTDDIFKPLPKPRDFDGPLITKQELKNLLDKYPQIANTKGKNGDIRSLFNEKFDTGIPLALNNNLNDQFKEEFKQLLTFIKNCQNEKEQEILLNQLKAGFMDCEPGMQRCVSEMLGEQRSFEAGFADQVKIKIHEFKNQMLEELILTHYPDAYATKTPYLQMTHLKSGYIASLGKELGLQGVEESNLDKNKYKFIKHGELDKKKSELKQKILDNFETFIKNYALELNNPKITSDRGVGVQITTWKEKYENDVDAGFFYHAEEKKEFYEGLGEPTDEQEGSIIPFVSHAELRKCLDILGMASLKTSLQKK